MNLFKPVRFLKKEEIEDKANEVLMKMKKEGFIPKWPFEASYVADALEIRIDRGKIPPDKEGIIAAKIEPIKRLITINELFFTNKKINKGLEESTIAHEIGHWVLHVNQDEADGIVKQLELPLNCQATPQLFLCRSLDKSHQTTFNSKVDIEWQAQYFASCLLMPRYILEEKRRGRNLTNWSHLYAMVDELGVTISNLTNRLQDLGWINIPKGSKQIYLGNSGSNGQKKLF